MRTVLVTGGAGFMGSHFIRRLLELYPRYYVVNLDKLTYAGNPENLRDIEARYSSRYRFIRGDIADPKIVRSAVKGVDAVVNFAAESHVDRSLVDISPFVHAQIMGTHTLLTAAHAEGVKRYVQISTDEVYGSREKGSFREDHPVNPSNPYSVSKAAADALALAHGRTWGIPVLVTRATNNYGPNQYPEKAIPLFITNLLEEKKIPLYGRGEHVREWLYVVDHAAAVDTVLHKGKPGEIYNIGSAERMANRELAGGILKLLGKDDSWIDYVADRPGHDMRYALSTAKIRALGWNPRYRMKEALAETVQWYRNNPQWWGRIKQGDYRNYYQTHYIKREKTFTLSRERNR